MCLPALGAAPPAEATLEPEETGHSRQIFLEMMSDPAAQAIFLGLQHQLLNTKEDNALRSFIESSPALSHIAQMYRDSQDKLLQDFARDAQVNMLRVERGMTRQYDILDRLVVETAIDLGFDREAIAKREIFVQYGAQNAFTVSGNQDRIIVVVTSEILKTMNKSELRGVLAHEMGHIRSAHTIQGQVSAILMSFVAHLYSNGAEEVFIDENLGEWSRLHKVLVSNSTVDKHFAFRRYQDTQSKSKATENRKEAMSLLNQLSEKGTRKLIAGYLDIMINTMQVAGSHSSSINYFKYLRKNLKSLGDFSIHPEEFSYNAAEALAAMSRMEERSADQYAASIIRNTHLASAFAKFLGLEFSRPERDSILEQLRKQAQYFQENYIHDEKAPHVGYSHPAPALRIDFLMNIKNYPTVAFANPFLRLLLLDDAIDKHVQQVQSLLQQSGEEKNYYRSLLRHLTKQKKQFETTLVAMIAELGWTRLRNPRFENLLQYYLVKRESTLHLMENLRLSEDHDKKVQEELLTYLEQELNTPNSLLNSIRNALKRAAKHIKPQSQEGQIVTARLSSLDLAMQSQSRRQIRQERATMTLNQDGSERPTRISMKTAAPSCAQLFL